jgi:lysophospholipase L1-like esterase
MAFSMNAKTTTPSYDRGSASQLRGYGGKLIVLLVTFLLMLSGSEIAARRLWKWQYNRFLERQLGGFDRVDRKDSVVLLVPGTAWSLRYLIENLKEHNKTLGIREVEAIAQKYGIRPDDVVLQVNSHGFLGPEIQKEKRPGTLRIMTIGDSVTFGSYVGASSYPRAMERELNHTNMTGSFKFEVVNAGVRGYNLQSVIKRIDYFLEFKPDIITILIGWNHTILRADPRKNEDLYRNLALYRIFYHAVINRSLSVTMPASPENFYNKNDVLMAKLRDTTFSSDFGDWENLIERIRRRLPKSRIVVISLAGLFMEDVDPDPAAMTMAFSVAFSRNLYSWAVLTSAYNRKLLEFANRHELSVIDLAEWSKSAFQPRYEFFVDSVHMTDRGYDLVGKFLAAEILKTQVSGGGSQ